MRDEEQKEEKDYRSAITNNVKQHGLSKSERIKSKKDFEKVFSSGITVFSSDKKLKATYYFCKTTKRGAIKAAFAVHRKAGTAVWRNRAKRLLRESYRLNKDILYSSFDFDRGILQVVFSLKNINQKKQKRIHLNEFEPAVVELMNKIRGSI